MAALTEWGRVSGQRCDWSEVHPGCGVWLCRRPIAGGVGLSCANRSACEVEVEVAFKEYRNAAVEVKGGGGPWKCVVLGPGEAEDVAVFMALDPSLPINCTYQARCRILPRGHTSPKRRRDPAWSPWTGAPPPPPPVVPHYDPYALGLPQFLGPVPSQPATPVPNCGGGGGVDAGWDAPASPRLTESVAEVRGRVQGWIEAHRAGRGCRGGERRRRRPSAQQGRRTKSVQTEPPPPQPPDAPPPPLPHEANPYYYFPPPRDPPPELQTPTPPVASLRPTDAWGAAVPGGRPAAPKRRAGGAGTPRTPTTPRTPGMRGTPRSAEAQRARQLLEATAKRFDGTGTLDHVAPPTPMLTLDDRAASTAAEEAPAAALHIHPPVATDYSASSSPPRRDGSTSPPPIPANAARTELMRVPVEPGSDVVVVVERIGASAIGFRAENGGNQDGQVEIDLSNAKNCKVIPLGDRVEGGVVTAKLLRGAVRNVALAMKKAQGQWSWSHTLSWLPHTGTATEQEHALSASVVLLKRPAQDVSWDFFLRNDGAAAVELTVDFEGSSNLSVFPLANAVYPDAKRPLVVLANCPGGGVEVAVCNVGPAVKSRGWAWAYKTSFHETSNLPAALPAAPIQTTFTTLTDHVSLAWLMYDATQTHVMVHNNNRRPVQVQVTFSRADSYTILPSKHVRKHAEQPGVYEIIVDRYSKTPFVVFVFSDRAATPVVEYSLVTGIANSDAMTGAALPSAAAYGSATPPPRPSGAAQGETARMPPPSIANLLGSRDRAPATSLSSATPSAGVPRLNLPKAKSSRRPHVSPRPDDA